MLISYRNIVATVNLDCKLDLKTIALHARNAEYNPKVYYVILKRLFAYLLLDIAVRCCYYAY